MWVWCFLTWIVVCEFDVFWLTLYHVILIFSDLYVSMILLTYNEVSLISLTCTLWYVSLVFLTYTVKGEFDESDLYIGVGKFGVSDIHCCMWGWFFLLTLLNVSLMFPVSRPEALLSEAICEAKSSNTVLTSTINPFSWNRAKCQWSKPKWHHNREEQAFVKQFWY